MRKYLLYLALPFFICIISCETMGSSKATPHKQKLKENLESTTMVDSIEQQIKAADAELKTFLKEH